MSAIFVALVGWIALFSGLLLIGWLCFSIGAGIVVYLTSLTTNHVNLEPQSLRKVESTSIMRAHAEDPVIMKPLNAAKERWYGMEESERIQRLSLMSNDGLLLVGYYLQAIKKNERSLNTVILVHGMYDSAAGMAYLAEEYHKRDWNVLSIDLRSHGESEGTKRTMGVREAEDLALWVEYVEKNMVMETLFLHGLSMGAATVLLYAGNVMNAGKEKDTLTSVKGIIADSSYSSYKSVFVRLVRMIVKNSFVAHSIVWGASWASFLFTGIFFSAMRPDKAIEKISVPVLLFHGEKDTLVPLSMVSDLVNRIREGDVDGAQLCAEACACDDLKLLGELVVVPESPHIGAYFYAPELYMKKIVDFTGRI